MKRTALLILLRVAVALAIAVPVLLFFVFFPHNRALIKVDQQVNGVATMAKALEDGEKKLKELPEPKSLKLQTFKAAREHAQTVNTALPIFNIKVPEKAYELSPQWKGLKITRYNDIVDDPQYAVAVAQAGAALRNGKAFVDYHYATMRAVANVLDYNPTKDTESDLGEEIYNGLLATKGGLELASKRLKDSPKYKDATLQDILDKITEIEIARKAYENAVSVNRLDGPERNRYIAAFGSAQELILANRQKFWTDNYEPIRLGLTLAAKNLKSYNLELNRI